MTSAHTRLWIVVAVAVAAAGLVWSHANVGTDHGDGCEPGARSGELSLHAGQGDRIAGHKAGRASGAGIRRGAELRGPARPDHSDPVVLRSALVRRLTADRIDWREVARLLERLDGSVDATVRGILIQELRAGRRNDAMVAFEALRDGTLVADLFALLDDAEAPRGASRAVLKALARMPGADPDDVARRLGARLSDGTEPRDELLRAIARRGGAEAARVLVDHVECAEAPESIPQHLLRMLALEGDAPAEDVLLEALRREQEPAVLRMLLVMVSKPGASRFAQTLIDLDRGEESADQRARLLASLGSIGGEAAVAYLLETAEEGDAAGAGAVRALGYVRVADASTCDRLLTALRQAGRGVDGEALKQSLVGALGALRYEPALLRIVRHLQDPSPAVRRACVRALGRLGTAARGQVGLLTRMYTEGEPSLHMSLAVALGRIGGPEALDAMETMFRAEDLTPGLRKALQGGIHATIANRSQ